MNPSDFKKMTTELMTWREKLHKTHHKGSKKPNLRGSRAELRRSKTITEVILTPSYQRLCITLSNELESFNDADKERLAFVVGVLSHVKTPTTKAIAKAMSTGNPPCVSELRFRRLLQHERDQRFYVAMIRMIKMLKYTVNVQELIETLFYWDDGKKKKWAYAYFS